MEEDEQTRVWSRVFKNLVTAICDGKSAECRLPERHTGTQTQEQGEECYLP
jgi:hypothetical protein